MVGDITEDEAWESFECYRLGGNDDRLRYWAYAELERRKQARKEPLKTAFARRPMMMLSLGVAWASSISMWFLSLSNDNGAYSLFAICTAGVIGNALGAIVDDVKRND